jgi:hypothetical protein
MRWESDVDKSLDNGEALGERWRALRMVENVENGALLQEPGGVTIKILVSTAFP